MLVNFHQWVHFEMLIIRNLNLISIQSWTFLDILLDLATTVEFGCILEFVWELDLQVNLMSFRIEELSEQSELWGFKPQSSVVTVARQPSKRQSCERSTCLAWKVFISILHKKNEEWHDLQLMPQITFASPWLEYRNVVIPFLTTCRMSCDCYCKRSPT